MTDIFDSDIESHTPSEQTYTSSEIHHQPETWKATWKKIRQEEETLSSFLNEILRMEGLNIILTGAGSSAFVGNVVASTWQKDTERPAKAVPTTDLVTHWQNYILPSEPLLLISFARSGNSPESTASIEQLNKGCDNVFHLIITCNPDGKLAQMKENENTCVFLLPQEAEDKSLAMTNSFTSMALAATLISKMLKTETDYLDTQVHTLSSYGNTVLNNYDALLKEVAHDDFNRIVFLGSGPLQGIAREGHLKVQELTNGQVVGKFDSFLGFRHGPKAIINDNTLLVYLISNNKDTNRYERDLVSQINQHNIGLHTLGIAETECISSNIDYCITLADEQQLDEAFWAILCTLPAQIIGLHKSIDLGYNPDEPSPDGTISRVVEGVQIYNDSSNELKD
ncbi:SIS domain-containing protein [Fodinibius halophilus]|uniref:SIS domain-containing protein n=1 Tax=Fodinibius halophilus TaxID=1736908 RepID=A0A6M1T9G4_9BACT|nr:SIS domain-containing protein [Fodinibius halophilus]NGP89173.1 SIS domain-containing protein [Fodinibius halophilus]